MEDFLTDLETRKIDPPEPSAPYTYPIFETVSIERTPAAELPPHMPSVQLNTKGSNFLMRSSTSLYPWR